MRKGFETLAVVLIGISAGIAMSMKPWHVYVSQRKSTSQQVSEMRRTEQQHIQDLEEEAQLSSTIGREEFARQKGFHRIGEMPTDK